MAANLIYHDIKTLLKLGGCSDSATLRLPDHGHTMFSFVSQNRASHLCDYAGPLN